MLNFFLQNSRFDNCERHLKTTEEKKTGRNGILPFKSITEIRKSNLNKILRTFAYGK